MGIVNGGGSAGSATVPALKQSSHRRAPDTATAQRSSTESNRSWLPDITTLDERTLAPYLDPCPLLQPGQQYLLRPCYVKVWQEINAGSITVAVTGSSFECGLLGASNIDQQQGRLPYR